MSVLDKVRRWIDGESAELVLEEAAREAQVKPRSRSEEFIVKIARAVERVMQDEMVPLPQGTTIIPTEYIIFLSTQDDLEWQGAKRKGLEKGLYSILAERARELAGKKKLETQSFAVELRVDGTLEPGDVRIQHGCEEGSSGKTGVLSRKNIPSGSAPPTGTVNTPVNVRKSRGNPDAVDAPAFVNEISGQGGPPVGQNTGRLSRVAPIPPVEGEELTAVSPRKTALYGLEVWRGGIRQTVIPVFQSEIVIGRGSRSKPVDVVLKGDPEVSRRHIVIILDGLGNLTVINEGRNPAMINNSELPIGHRVPLAAGQPLNICSFMIRVQPSRSVGS